MLHESHVISFGCFGCFGCQTRIDYPFKSSMYEPIRDYHDLDVSQTHSILSKFCNQVHMWLIVARVYPEFAP